MTHNQLIRRLMGDFHEWGDTMGPFIKGLSVLGYNGVAGFLNNHLGGTGKPPQPSYWSRQRIKSLHNAIMTLENKKILLLGSLYIEKSTYREVQDQGICHKDTVKKWIDETVEDLIAKKYWKY